MSTPQRRRRHSLFAREAAFVALIAIAALTAIPAAAAAAPDAFTVVNGKLYLNYNKRVMRQWLEDRDRNIEQADDNWPAVLEE